MKNIVSQLQFLVLMLILISWSGLFAQEKMNVAVLDFNAEVGLSASEATTLTNRLRSMLVKTSAYNVLDRGKMQEILGEIGFQMTGCTSTECAVEAGKILNVQQMITGSVGKIGKTYTLDILVIDVGSAKIIRSVYEDYKGEIDGLLDLMGSISNKLAGLKGAPEKPAAAVGGSLLVKTSPVSGTVFVDNVKKGTTPVNLDNLTEGEHTVRITADGYADIEDKVMIKKGIETVFEEGFKKIFTLQINSVPAGADIFINNQFLAKSPKSQKVKEGVSFDVRVKLKNYQDWVQTVTITRDMTLNASMINIKADKKMMAQKDKEEGVQPKKGSKKWWWITGGVVVAGGAAAAILAGSGKDKSETSGFPEPPDRP